MKRRYHKQTCDIDKKRRKRNQDEILQGIKAHFGKQHDKVHYFLSKIKMMQVEIQMSQLSGGLEIAKQ